MKFNLVQYGSDPAEYLEPVNAAEFNDLVGQQPTTIGFRDNGIGRMANVRLIQGRYSPFHAYDDYDAAQHDF